MLEGKKGKKVAGIEEAAKNKEMRKSRAELGLHPATPPTGAMAESSLYFNWRAQGKGSRSPVNTIKSRTNLPVEFWTFPDQSTRSEGKARKGAGTEKEAGEEEQA